ncbi:PGA30 [Candida oxycetoniae]|uniref:PGA30 n=1 Tax=Candida oxycetoniae TaxID=497107 RepID=A0AAI9WZ33_9ASCO|nr:PGA30 [Candida oxycetoniae]KAI3405485.1 PGA30 [Candida oxycetoniae]
MRVTTFASVLSLSASALAAVRPVQLFASSDNEEVNGKGLYSTHEGAGVNYFFLGSAQTLQYNDESRVLYIELSTQPPASQYLAFEGDVLALTVASEPLPVDIGEDGSVVFPGSDALAAAKNINDPYRYSESVFAVVKASVEGSTPLTLKAVFTDVDEEVEPSSTTEEAVAEETSSFAYINETVTIYTTYCPEPTTLTVTVCDTVCEESEITVSEPGYVTLTNAGTEAEATTAAPTEASSAEEESPATAAPEESSVQSVFEGSASNLGAGSVLAVAAVAFGLVF